MTTRFVVSTLVMVGALSAPARAQVSPPRDALAAWTAYVHATEARIARERAGATGFFARDSATDAASVRRRALAGELLITSWQTPAPPRRGGAAGEWDIPDGQIHHWVGTVFVPGVTLSALLDRLQGVDVQRRQPDVLAARVLTREPQALSIHLRLRRSQIVTVTYDTEHRVQFMPLGPSRAMSTTTATRIVELREAGTAGERALGPGEDRGFLWRLNAYWRYEAVAGGVLVECESLSLSRRAPLGLGAIASPFVTRVARESMSRTLEALRAVLGQSSPVSASTARAGR
jgi:hypothetical protein